MTWIPLCFANMELCGFLCPSLLLSLCESHLQHPFQRELLLCALSLSPDAHTLSLIDLDHFLPDKTLFNGQPLLSS